MYVSIWFIRCLDYLNPSRVPSTGVADELLYSMVSRLRSTTQDLWNRTL